MNRQQLKSRLVLLQKLSKLDKSDRSRFLKECNSECIHAICEACYNLLYNTLQLQKPALKKATRNLSKIKGDFKKLAEKKVSVNTKRKILSKRQTGDGIFTILAGTIIPALVSLLAKK